MQSVLTKTGNFDHTHQGNIPPFIYGTGNFDEQPNCIVFRSGKRTLAK
jgi:hypothetical protein